MGIFEDLGRRVERLKREVEAGADAAASHECRECGERLHADRDRCPECGSESVAPVGSGG